jgi:SanA protein
MITKWMYRIIIVGFAGLAIIAWMDWRVAYKTSAYLYQDIETIPAKKIGLVLGTSRTGRGSNLNPFYKHRIAAAVALYNAGKIRYVLVSGDNSTKNYDEPTSMKLDLVANGVPDSVIFLDYAGFSTMASIIRCKKVFNETDITIISQQFHNERAIYLALANNMTAVGYNANDVRGKYGWRTRIREYLARVKVHLDIWFSKEPYFLGDEITIG